MPSPGTATLRSGDSRRRDTSRPVGRTPARKVLGDAVFFGDVLANGGLDDRMALLPRRSVGLGTQDAAASGPGGVPTECPGNTADP